MLRKIEIGLFMLLACGLVSQLATAQVSLEDQLKAQYTMVKMGSDTSGAAVVEQGTILAIKKGGILSVPYTDNTVMPTKYENGTVHSPNALLSKGLGFGMKRLGREQTTRLMQVGEKVYPSKITVNLPKDQVAFNLIACDSCNNTSPTTFYKAEVVFQFGHGSLATASPSQIEDTIAALLAVDDSASADNSQQGGGQGGGNDQQGGGQGGGNDQQGGGNGQQGNNYQGGGGGQSQAQAPPAEPQQIEKGQTPDQVKNSIGQPDKIINLGTKQIYVYKDIKVTFLNGKVSDVQ